MGVWVNLCRCVTVVACVIAAIVLTMAFGLGLKSAVQQAAAAAIAVGIAVIPYVFTRMFEGFLFKPAEPKVPTIDQQVEVSD